MNSPLMDFHPQKNFWIAVSKFLIIVSLSFMHKLHALSHYSHFKSMQDLVFSSKIGHWKKFENVKNIFKENC